MDISLSTRETTLYTVNLMGGRTYETFDYDQAQRALRLESAGIPAAPCSDCKAVVPVALVDTQHMEVLGIPVDNACPSNTSKSQRGHRVSRVDYDAAKAIPNLVW